MVENWIKLVENEENKEADWLKMKKIGQIRLKMDENGRKLGKYGWKWVENGLKMKKMG